MESICALTIETLIIQLNYCVKKKIYYIKKITLLKNNFSNIYRSRYGTHLTGGQVNLKSSHVHGRVWRENKK